VPAPHRAAADAFDPPAQGRKWSRPVVLPVTTYRRARSVFGRRNPVLQRGTCSHLWVCSGMGMGMESAAGGLVPFPWARGGLGGVVSRARASVGGGRKREYDVYEGRRALTGEARVGRVFKRDVKLSLAWLKRLNDDWQHHTLVLKPVPVPEEAGWGRTFGGGRLSRRLADAAWGWGWPLGCSDGALLIHFQPHSDDPDYEQADTEVRLFGGGRNSTPTRGRAEIEEFKDDGSLQLTHCGRASLSLAELREFADETSRTRHYSVGKYDCRHFKAEALQRLAVQPGVRGTDAKGHSRGTKGSRWLWAAGTPRLPGGFGAPAAGNTPSPAVTATAADAGDGSRGEAKLPGRQRQGRR